MLHHNTKATGVVHRNLLPCAVVVTVLFFLLATMQEQIAQTREIHQYHSTMLRSENQYASLISTKESDIAEGADGIGEIPQLTLENYEAMTKGKTGVLVRFCASWVST